MFKIISFFIVLETCVFAYLGLAIFAVRHRFDASLVVWTIVSFTLVCKFLSILLVAAVVSDWKSM